jgi:hypothetical protein
MFVHGNTDSPFEEYQEELNNLRNDSSMTGSQFREFEKEAMESVIFIHVNPKEEETHE